MGIGFSLRHEHSPEAIAARLRAGPGHSYLRDWIYGGIDGAVTTFAVVTGSIGGQLATKTILILGFANLIADGFSMAAGNFLGTRSEMEEWKRLYAYEKAQIKAEPEGEREETRQILERKGFRGKFLEDAVALFTSEPERWVELMLAEEYGLPTVIRSPVKAALSTFSAFLISGFVPLAPFVLGAGHSEMMAVILTLAVFFLIGSMKSYWSVVPWWRSGFTTLVVGALAASLAFVVGRMLSAE